MFGYNDMNTNVPNPFATQGNIVLSGAGRKKLIKIDIKMWDDEKPKIVSGAEFNKRRKAEMQKQFEDEMEGAGKKLNRGKYTTLDMKPKDWARMRKAEEDYEPKYELYGSGWMDDINKGYNKSKSAVKSETGQKIKKALMEDKDFIKEFNKAKNS